MSLAAAILRRSAELQEEQKKHAAAVSELMNQPRVGIRVGGDTLTRAEEAEAEGQAHTVNPLRAVK